MNIAASIKVMDDSSPYCLSSIKKLLLTLLRPRDPLRARSSPTKVPTIAQHEPRGKRDAGIGAYGPLLPFDRRGTSTCPLPSRERVEFPCHTSPCCTLSFQSSSPAMLVASGGSAQTGTVVYGLERPQVGREQDVVSPFLVKAMR